MVRCYILLEMHKRANRPVHIAAFLQFCTRVWPLLLVAFPLRDRGSAGRPRAHRSARRPGEPAHGGAAPRSRPARLAGTDAARRFAQARARTADQDRGASPARCRGVAGRNRAGRHHRTTDEAAGRRRARRGPISRPGSSKCTSSGRPDTCACCSPRPTSGASGRRRARSPRSRNSIAIASRRISSRSTSSRRHARRSTSGAAASTALRAEARRAEPKWHERHRPAAMRFATSTASAISTRSSPASCRSPSRSCRPRCATLAAGSPVGEPASLPLKPFRGDLDWPIAGTVRRRFGEFRRRSHGPVERDRDRRDGGRSRHRRPRRRRRVCGHLQRFRQPRHRRSRRAGLQPVRQFARYWREKGGDASRPARRSEPSAPRSRDQPGCTSSCASTVSRSIPYNGLEGS